MGLCRVRGRVGKEEGRDGGRKRGVVVRGKGEKRERKKGKRKDRKRGVGL